jgi:nitroreductase
MSSDAGFDLEVVDRLLSTTRAVRRRLDLDRAVPRSVVEECLSLALQAPSGSNLETWRWLVITDPTVKEQIAELYRNPVVPKANPGSSAGLIEERLSEHERQKLNTSSEYLRQNLERVPVLVVPCVEAVGGAAGWPPSIYPAVWSLMLALRSRGLGSVMTTTHLYRRDEADRILGIPEGYVQSCLVPVAYTIGTDFRPADRRSVREVAFLDHWGSPLTEG